MASDTVADWLKALPKGSRVLDPMCGSGVVVRQSALLGHRAKGFDIDPLAVLMSQVWTRQGSHTSLRAAASRLIASAKRKRTLSYANLPWVAKCNETRQFIEYWFAEPQRTHLARLAFELQQSQDTEETWVDAALRLSLSKIIITKHVGASLAWDVSHSRPHRVRTQNNFDVYDNYERAINRLVFLLDSEPLPISGIIKSGDCRNLTSIQRSSIDAVVTSPPYLNAIDYLRGHKLALVWLGHTIPSLRATRAGAVGTECAGLQKGPSQTELEDVAPFISALPQRQRAIVHKYASDAYLILKEMKRVLSNRGLMVLVLGDSNLRSIPVYNSLIFKHLANRHGFVMEDERKRPLQNSRRYLPISDKSGALANRMKFEVLQVYRAASSA